MNYARLLPAVFLGGAVYLWFVASNFRSGMGQYQVLGPSFFPKLLLAGLIAVTVVELAVSLRGARRPGAAIERPAERPYDFKNLALTLAVTVGYVGGLRFIGFLPATFLFQLAMLALVFRQRPAVAFGVPVVLTALFFGIFSFVMGVPLPRGSGVFYTLSRFIY